MPGSRSVPLSLLRLMSHSMAKAKEEVKETDALLSQVSLFITLQYFFQKFFVEIV